MKKILFFSFLLLFSFKVFAQDTWATILPYNTDDAWLVSKMIKTSDDGFALFFKHSGPQMYLLKYNSEGEYVWEKEYFWGESYHLRPKDIIELPNGDLVMVGAINTPAWYQYIFIADAQGDSLSRKLYSEYIVFGDLDSDGDNLFLRGLPNNGSIDSIALLKFDASGVLLSESKVPNLGQTNVNGVGEDIVTLEEQLDSIAFFKFDFEGQLELQRTYFNELGMNGSALIGRGESGNIAFYQEEGLMVLTGSFDILYTLPADDDNLGFPETSWQLRPEQILPTSDGGFLLSGHTWNPDLPFETSRAYLIKIDNQGQIVWKRLYDMSSLPLNNLPYMVEVEGGYVVTGVQLNEGRIWLIKMNDQGIVVAVDEIIGSSGLSLYPNPSVEKVNLLVPESLVGGKIYVFNSQGREVLQQNVASEREELQIEELPKGVYFVKVLKNDYTKVYSTRFIKI